VSTDGSKIPSHCDCNQLRKNAAAKSAPTIALRGQEANGRISGLKGKAALRENRNCAAHQVLPATKI
jgi:hypothetical protein